VLNALYDDDDVQGTMYTVYLSIVELWIMEFVEGDEKHFNAEFIMVCWRRWETFECWAAVNNEVCRRREGTFECNLFNSIMISALTFKL